MKVKIKVKGSIFDRNIISYHQIICPSITHLTWRGAPGRSEIHFLASCKVEELDNEILCAFITKDGYLTPCVIDKEYAIVDLTHENCKFV